MILSTSIRTVAACCACTLVGLPACSATTPAGTAATAASDAATTAETAASIDAAKPPAFADNYPLLAQFPEGGAYDSAGHAFFVGSLSDGSVHRIDAATGAQATLFTETAKGKWWSLGMDVDVARRHLWVCAMDDRETGSRAGFIWVFDLATGKRIANHPLEAAAKDATCTDVAVSKAGVGYVVDREQGNVYAVDLGTGAVLFAAGADLKGGPVGGQNAVVVLPDESALLSVVYLPPKLVRVDLQSKAVKAVALTGPFSDDALLAGADGMAFAKGKAYVAFSSKLVEVTPADAAWGSAATKVASVKEGMTDVIATPNGLYLSNGQAVRFALGQATDPFALVRFAGSF